MFSIISQGLYKSILSGLSHTLCIAILEIMFYIFYITKLERESMLDMVSDIGGEINESCAQNIKNPDNRPKISPIMKFGLDEQVKKMELENEVKKDELDEKNKKFYTVGIIIILSILGITILFALLFAPKNNKHLIMWLNIGRDVSISLIFVAIFEYILVNQIIMKYNIIDLFSVKLELLKGLLNSDRCYQVGF